jgi:hypothetical protein
VAPSARNRMLVEAGVTGGTVAYVRLDILADVGDTYYARSVRS